MAQLLALQHCSVVSDDSYCVGIALTSNHVLRFQIAASEESLRSCEEQCAAQGIQFFVFNPLINRPLTLSVDVSLKDTVESVVQAIGQVSGKPLESLLTLLKNN